MRRARISLRGQVDAVATDPSIATDADRIWQYLSPSIFRMLLPVSVFVLPLLRPTHCEQTVRNLGKEQAMKEAAEQAVQAAAAQAKATENLNNDLTETKRQLSSAESTLKDLK